MERYDESTIKHKLKAYFFPFFVFLFKTKQQQQKYSYENFQTKFMTQDDGK